MASRWQQRRCVDSQRGVPSLLERVRHVLFTVPRSRPSSSSLGTAVRFLASTSSVLLCPARFAGDVRRRGASACSRELPRVTIRPRNLGAARN